MRYHTKTALIALFAATLILALAWLFGVNFDHRGQDVAFPVALVFIVIGGVIAIRVSCDDGQIITSEERDALYQTVDDIRRSPDGFPCKIEISKERAGLLRSLWIKT